MGDYKTHLDNIDQQVSLNRGDVSGPLDVVYGRGVDVQSGLANRSYKADLEAQTSTTVNLKNAGHFTALPIILMRHGRIAVLTALPTAVTISGASGTKYIYADIAVPGANGISTSVTLVFSTTAPNAEATTFRIPLGSVQWDGAIITSVTSFHGTAAVATVPKQSQQPRGLYLRTHPDGNVAASKVMLVHADAIVMDDGTLVETWDRFVADITLAGAGGLDTGAEAASTWYEIWAIQKSSDLTKAIILHRAKDYFKDEIYDVGEDGHHVLRAATAPINLKLAQGFKVDTSGKIEMVWVKLGKVGFPASGHVWMEIQGNNAGVPNNAVLATSDKLEVTTIDPGEQTIRFIFRTPATLTAATQYHLVLNGDYTQSDTEHLKWQADTTAATYANGSKATTTDGSAWTADADDDCIFKGIFVTRNDTAVTLPTGYDRKTKIGYVYNNSGSAFVRMEALDRCVGLERTAITSSITTVSELFDLSTLVPPGVITVDFNGSNDTAGEFVFISGVEKNPASRQHGVVQSASAGQSNNFTAVTIEYQGVYAEVGFGVGTLRQLGYTWS